MSVTSALVASVILVIFSGHRKMIGEKKTVVTSEVSG